VLTAAAILFFAAPRPCSAEWQFAPFIGWTFKGNTTVVDLEAAVPQVHWNVGGVVTLIGDSPFGVEGYFVRTPNFFDREEIAQVENSLTYAIMGNAVLATPRSWNRYGLRPYVSAGLGRLHVFNEDSREFIAPILLNLLGMNVGGGAVGFVSDRVGLRFDLRFFRNIRGVEPVGDPVSPLGPVRIRYWTTSVGVVIKY
jgi:hypothetical protein